MDYNSEEFKQAVAEVIKPYLSSPAFSDKKTTDTPTDDLQVVNKKYVDNGQFYARMYASSNQTIGSAFSPYATVNIDTVNFSKGLTCDTVNHKITVLSAGIYFIYTAADYSNTIISNTIEIGYSVNGGSVVSSEQAAPTSSQYSTSYASLVSLNANDYIQVNARSQGGNITLLGSSFQTFIAVFKI